MMGQQSFSHVQTHAQNACLTYVVIQVAGPHHYNFSSLHKCNELLTFTYPNPSGTAEFRQINSLVDKGKQ